MPIIGLTDGVSGMQFPRIATLKKGAPKQPNRPGKDLDYFRVEFVPEYVDLEPDFIDLYGEEPRQFRNIRFTSDSVHEVFPTWREQWNGSGTLVCRTDGEMVVRWYDPVANQYRNDSKPFSEDEYPDTKQVGRLSFFLPDLVSTTGMLGVVTLITSSFNDISLIHSRLTMLQGMYGRLTGVPFTLSRVAREISAPMNGKRGKTTKNLIALDVDPAFTSNVLLPHLTQQAALPVPDDNDPLALPPTVDDDPEPDVIEGEIEAASWYDDKGNRQKFDAWLETRELTLEGMQKLTGKKPEDYASGQEACEDVINAINDFDQDGWRESSPRIFFREVEHAGLDYEYVLNNITDKPIKGPIELKGWTLSEVRERLQEMKRQMNQKANRKSTRTKPPEQQEQVMDIPF